MNMKEAVENALKKMNKPDFAMKRTLTESDKEQKRETPESKALDMVEHLTAAFNLPVFSMEPEDVLAWLKNQKTLVKPNEYCIIRTYSAGVFAGYVEQLDGKNAVLRDTRRIWRWAGACSLSQLAVDGTSEPDECRFAVPVERTIVTEVIEIIPCTEKAKESILGVKEWKI